MLIAKLLNLLVTTATEKVISQLEASKVVPVVIPLQQGFAYKDKETVGGCRREADFARYFRQAHALTGTNGAFASARLYTAIQCNTTADPSGAFKAAVATNTSLLVGLDASGGSKVIDNEIKALLKAVDDLGETFTKLVVGISVGNEDLYRNSDACSGCPQGATASTVVGYVKKVRSKIVGTKLAKVPVGHCDTGTAWALSSTKPVITEVDFVGHNSHPYWESKVSNSIMNAPNLFIAALNSTEKAANGKAVWVTETGWPWRGDTSGKGIPSKTNAESYWLELGCSKLFGKRSTWWLQLADNDPVEKDLSFSVILPNATTPLFNLACSSS